VSEEWAAIRKECLQYKRAALADSTKATYKSMSVQYPRFCLYFGRRPVPATKKTILGYAVFLARTHNPSKVPPYLNIIKLLHDEAGLPNPLAVWELTMVKRGINRCLGRPPRQKLPITLDILQKIYNTLDLSDNATLAFWAACLIAFFGFLRKSTLLPKSSNQAEIKKSIMITDVTVAEDKSCISIKIRHTKTIQFGQRCLTLPFMAVPDSQLCPVEAVVSMLARLKGAPLTINQPLFSFMSQQNRVSHLTHSTFSEQLRSSLVNSGTDPSEYSGHSFRRGGCSHAFALGIPPALVKLRGDWKSNAYERYIHINGSCHETMAQALALSAANHVEGK
jgi:hypothetical protein